MAHKTVKRVCIALTDYDKKILDELCEEYKETISSIVRRSLTTFYEKKLEYKKNEIGIA